MDKAKLLDSISADAEERMLLARVLDRREQCLRRNAPTHIGFLSPAQCAAAQQLLTQCGARDGFAFHGGFDDAQRKMLFFLPEWQEEPDIDNTICHISSKIYETESVSHRDVLGSLMGMGVARETIGDILVTENTVHVLAASEVADFLLTSWDSAGRVHLAPQLAALDALPHIAPRVREIRDTVAALRLDAVIASGFSLSRARAAEIVEAGAVQLNYRTCAKGTQTVCEGDTISVRGMGKFTVAQIGGTTKKGRVFITLHRYI